MNTPTGKVRKGQAISADLMNKALQAANRGLQDNLGALTGNPAQMICGGHNASASTIEPLQPVFVTGQVYANPDRKRDVVLDVSADAGDNENAVVVALDQIAPGRVGRVCCMGLCVAASAAGRGNYGILADGDDELTPGESGPLEIIWNSGTGIALVRIGGGGGGSITYYWPEYYG